MNTHSLGLCFVGILLLTACSPTVPLDDVQEARQTFSALQEAHVDTLAPASYMAASNAYDLLLVNLSAKVYEKTPELAQASIEASKKALSDAKALYPSIKANVANLAVKVNTTADQVKLEVEKVAKDANTKVDVAQLKAEVVDADQNLKQAKSDLKRSHFFDALTKLKAASSTFTAVRGELASHKDGI